MFEDKELHPADLKSMVTKEINRFFDKIRARFTPQQQNELIKSAQL